LADKENAMVTINIKQYEEKMEKILEKGPYKVLNKNPLNKFIKQVKGGTKKVIMDEKQGEQLIVSCPILPRIYGVPKIHKEGVLLRPILSAINSPIYNMEGHLAQILNQKIGQTTSYIKNSSQFAEKIREMNWEPGDILVSFDVISLFTMVPYADTLKIIKDKQWLDENQHTLLELCTKSAVFTYKEIIYEQTDGMAMGSRLASVFSNIFMEWLNQKAIETSNFKPKTWFRYVDDTFVQ